MAIGRIMLAPSERRVLERRARSRSLEAEDCKRAKLILPSICDGCARRRWKAKSWKLRAQGQATEPPTRVAIDWPNIWALVIRPFIGSGASLAFNRIGCGVIW